MGRFTDAAGNVKYEAFFSYIFAASVPSGTGTGPDKRAEMLGRLQSGTEFDILVIGGGATGLGSALNAARRGYKVALVERGDFGCGTSSKSSNMIHGGVRYLQAFVKDPEGAKDQIGVVKRGLDEQNYIYNSAPYLVRPCPFMVAVYSERERVEYGKLLA